MAVGLQHSTDCCETSIYCDYIWSRVRARTVPIALLFCRNDFTTIQVDRPWSPDHPRSEILPRSELPSLATSPAARAA